MTFWTIGRIMKIVLYYPLEETHLFQILIKHNKKFGIKFLQLLNNHTYSHSAFLEVQPHRQRFPHEDVGVVTGEESPFQFFQLPTVKVRSASSSFRSRAFRICFTATASST